MSNVTKLARKPPDDSYESPQNLDAEESVIGAMLLGNVEAIEAVLDSGLEAKHYYSEKHRLIHKAIIHLHNEGLPADAISVFSHLERGQKNELERAGGKLRIQELAALVPPVSTAGHHASLVREKAIRRSFLTTGQKVSQLAWDGIGDVDELRIQLEGLIEQAEEMPQQQGFQPLWEADDPTLASILAGEQPHTVPTGFLDLDARLNGGLRPGQVMVLGGRPGMGKSALVLNIVNNVTANGGTVAFFSAEMTQDEVKMRHLALEARINYKRILRSAPDGKWKLDADETTRLQAAFERLRTRRVRFTDNGDFSPGRIHAEAKRIKRKDGRLDLLVIDYLQLLVSDPDSKSAENRQAEVAAISRAIKRLATRLQIPVLALSSLSRNCEYRENKRPHLGDLRDSGAVESDADVVAFLYRDSKYKTYKPKTGENLDPTQHTKRATAYERAAELNIEKNRAGEEGLVKLWFYGQYQTFANVRLEDADSWPTD